MYEDDDILGKFEIKCSCVNLKIKIWKWWKNKKNKEIQIKNQIEEVKEESNIVGYNMMKFNLVILNLVLKIYLNLGNMTRQI
jgi:hypothetical protein